MDAGERGPAAPGAGGSRPDDTLRELCHELRHPPATIRALASALELECDLPPQAKARLDQIVAEARRIDQLCSHVLRAGSEAQPLVRLDKVVVEFLAAFGAGGCDVSAVVSPVVARVDETSVQRILCNLVDNACRAAGDQGHVLVAVWSTNSVICLEVSDDGPGFGHAPPGSASLGLPIVHSLAQRCGGRVEVATGPAGGAMVRVLLPPPRLDLVVLEGDPGADDGARAGGRASGP